MRSLEEYSFRRAAVPTLVTAVLFAGLRALASAQQTPGTLTRDTVIQGTLLPAGTIVTKRDPGHLSFSLQKPFRISGWLLPADTAVIHTQPDIVQYVLGSPTTLAKVPFESVVTFQYGKLEGKMTLARDAVITGIPCGADAEVYFNAGAVQECDLTRSQTIDGIPCAAGDFSEADATTQCTLAKPYSHLGYTWAAQSVVVFASKGESSVTIGPKPPDLLLFGRPLPPDTDVTFNAATLWRIAMKSAVLYHGCHVLDIDFEPGGPGNPTTSENSPDCNLLTIPANSLSRARGH
jgi:hypothetical protein